MYVCQNCKISAFGVYRSLNRKDGIKTRFPLIQFSTPCSPQPLRLEAITGHWNYGKTLQWQMEQNRVSTGVGKISGGLSMFDNTNSDISNYMFVSMFASIITFEHLEVWATSFTKFHHLVGLLVHHLSHLVDTCIKSNDDTWWRVWAGCTWTPLHVLCELLRVAVRQEMTQRHLSDDMLMIEKYHTGSN